MGGKRSEDDIIRDFSERLRRKKQEEPQRSQADDADDLGTEMELAAAFAKRAAEQLLYVAGMDWFMNSGERWQRDETLVRFTLANALCREAGSAAEERAKSRIETNKTAAAVVTIARPDLIALPSDFDRVPYELNTPAGVIDLRDGTMRPRAPGHRYMHCTAVAPAREGIAGTAFASFLTEITCGDVGLGSVSSKNARCIAFRIERAGGSLARVPHRGGAQR